MYDVAAVTMKAPSGKVIVLIIAFISAVLMAAIMAVVVIYSGNGNTTTIKGT